MEGDTLRMWDDYFGFHLMNSLKPEKETAPNSESDRKSYGVGLRDILQCLGFGNLFFWNSFCSRI